MTAQPRGVDGRPVTAAHRRLHSLTGPHPPDPVAPIPAVGSRPIHWLDPDTPGADDWWTWAEWLHNEWRFVMVGSAVIVVLAVVVAVLGRG